jgi:hypothetical protein
MQRCLSFHGRLNNAKSCWQNCQIICAPVPYFQSLPARAWQKFAI